MPASITAAMLYDLVHCPHRVTMDLFGNPEKRDPVSPFVQLLWERGHAFEQQVIEDLRLPFTNLRPHPAGEKERLTHEAMACGDELIYGGRISADDLVGEPDLLRRQGNGYVAGDIKSGVGVEGATEESDGKPKTHYAVQLALYTDILERLGLCGGRNPFVWDVHGDEVAYDLDAPQGVKNPTTLWAVYQECLCEARAVVAEEQETLPALANICKLCHWRTSCIKRLEEIDDLTLIPELGRAKRDAMSAHLRGVKHLAQTDLGTLVQGKKSLIPGVGPDTLRKFQARARLQTSAGAGPYLREPLALPRADLELFFDVETDPMRNVCYLHGFVERRDGDPEMERYVAFFVDRPTPEEEARAFALAWQYVRTSRPSVIYYYSPYERTTWRNLQRAYPTVVTEAETEAMFEAPSAVDLYHDVVRSRTEWPTRDHSIKTLASFLGFKWRDTDPSGASSIEWYHRWVGTSDPAVRQRILDYNEDDCRATRVLLDAVRSLPVRAA